MIDKIDLAEIIINEINNKYSNLDEIKLYIKIHKNLCNDVLYNNDKYKESVIILSHIFKNIMTDFCKEVTNCINKEGAYRNE